MRRKKRHRSYLKYARKLTMREIEKFHSAVRTQHWCRTLDIDPMIALHGLRVRLPY